jgi:cold shock CspA family protein
MILTTLLHTGRGWYAGFLKGRSRNCAFISSRELSELFAHDVFVGESEMGTFQKGDDVVFKLVLGFDGRPQAKRVQLVARGAAPDNMNIISVTNGNQEYNAPLHFHDLVVVPNCICALDDRIIFSSLRDELQWTARLHNSHFRGLNPRISKVYTQVVDAACQYFRLELAHECINYYPDAAHWRPYHRDNYVANENCTVILSFGSPRVLSFRHQERRVYKHIPQRDGMLLYFAAGVNIVWVHGIDPLNAPGHSGGRISISLWGTAGLQAY